MSSSQTLSPGGEPQLGRPRFSSPRTALVAVAHEGRHPMNMLPPPMAALLIPARKGYSRGKCPVSRFSRMVNCCKLPRFSTHRGNSPDSRLFCRSRCVRLDRFPSSGGIDPVRLLPSRRRYWRLERLPSWGGIDPVRRLLSCSTQSLERLPSWGGIDPVRLLLEMDRTCNSVRFPNSAGSLPFSGLSPGRRGDIVEMNLIVVTRDGVPDTVIPCQPDIAVVAFQLRMAVPLRVSLAAQRALQSATRPVFV